MKNVEFISLPDADAIAQRVASAWLDEIAAANRASKWHYVMLSGGRITQKLFASVVELSKSRGVRISGAHFFWADERCVPPADPESNFAAAFQHLFRPLSIAPDKIHRIRGELPPELAAKESETEILKVVSQTIIRLPLHSSPPALAKTSAQTVLPVLNLIFLGMGEDGHVASLFPSEPEAMSSDNAVYRAVKNSPKPPLNRVTVGYAAIAAAKQVWVLASGAGKEAALRESLRPGGQTPLARVLQSRSHTRIFSDVRY